VANGIPVMACNRIGFEIDPSGVLEGTQFWGSSFIAGPQGEILAQADHNTTEVVSALVDTARTKSVRDIWPFLRDRRIDAYDKITKRYID
jgi:N-carbamoylputrescine amidase